jgi:hypothetical protein
VGCLRGAESVRRRGRRGSEDLTGSALTHICAKLPLSPCLAHSSSVDACSDPHVVASSQGHSKIDRARSTRVATLSPPPDPPLCCSQHPCPIAASGKDLGVSDACSTGNHAAYYDHFHAETSPVRVILAPTQVFMCKSNCGYCFVWNSWLPGSWEGSSLKPYPLSGE